MIVSLSCVYYIEAADHDLMVCGVDAPYVYEGNSFCEGHIRKAIQKQISENLAKARQAAKQTR